MTHEFYNVDIDRHERGVKAAIFAGLLNGYSRIELAVNGNVQVAKKVLTRSPRAVGSHWNLPNKDKRILDKHESCGFLVLVILVCEVQNLVKEVPYRQFLNAAKLMPGKPGQGEYWQASENKLCNTKS